MKLLALNLLVVFALVAQVRPPAPADLSGNLPVQRIGGNDLIAVSTYDAPEFTRTVRVSSDGFIRLPMLKQRIKAEGLLPNELETAIADALKSEQLIVDPFVTITIAEYHSRPISVAGSVKNPITFQAYGTVTVLDALTRAGGLSDTAGAEILLSRSQTSGGQTQLLTQRIPVKGLIDMADPDLNVRLFGGEEIRVPEAGRIYVLGNVKKPGSFPIKENTETSVLKALAQAEGLTPYSQKIAYIYRREGGTGTNKNEIPIELKQIMDRKSPDVTLIANDILYIPDNVKRRTTMTALDRMLMFGAGAATALIYTTTIH